MTHPEPSPRLGWLLLRIVVLIVGGGGWFLVLAAQRAMGEGAP